MIARDKRKRSISFKTVWLVLLFCAIEVLTVSSQRNTVVGDLRLHKLESTVFGNTRTIRVLLPPGYDRNANKNYPVLYLNDGQNLFDVSTSQTGFEWRVDETVTELLSSGEIVPLIIVGIDNAGRRERSNEYLPFEDEFLYPPMPNPNGSKYPDFLTEEVMPFIDEKYPTIRGPEYTGLGGSSYGALITLYTVITKPGVFGRGLLESPSFYVSGTQILKDAESIKRLPEKIYVGVGTNEEAKKDCKPGDLTDEAVRDVLKLKNILLNLKFKKRSLSVFIDECAVHSENAYGRRFPDAIRFLYGKHGLK